MGTEIIYDETCFRGNELRKVAKEYLAVLPPETEVIVSTGSSGCSIASAMLVLSKRRLRHCYIRKDGESAHTLYFAGAEIERKRVTIVDDFIAVGTTIRRVSNSVSRMGGIPIAIIVSSCEPNVRNISKYCGCPIIETSHPKRTIEEAVESPF